MNKLYIIWLVIFGISQCLSGLLLCFAPVIPALESYAAFLSRAAGDEQGKGVGAVVTMIQFYGPVTLAWAVLFLAGLWQFVYQKASSLKPVLILSLSIWLVVDAVLSVSNGLYLHLYYNVPVYLLTLIPLCLLRAESTKFYKPAFRVEHFSGRSFLITGGSGFIGKSLVFVLLKSGAKVTVLTRHPEKLLDVLVGSLTIVKRLSDISDDEHFDFVINLAGESINRQRWTRSFKHTLVHSRVDTAIALYELIERLKHRPRAVINASAIGYYGDGGDQTLTEDAPAQPSFSSQLCTQWEAQACEIDQLGVRVSIARFGVVLGRYGGTLCELDKLFKMKLALQIGSDSQWFSWVHIDDALNSLLFLCLEGESKAYNIVAPAALTQRQLTECFSQVKHAWFKWIIPSFLLRAILGSMADEILLSSAKVEPRNLKHAGFMFKYPMLSKALSNLYSVNNS